MKRPTSLNLFYGILGCAAVVAFLFNACRDNDFSAAGNKQVPPQEPAQQQGEDAAAPTAETEGEDAGNIDLDPADNTPPAGAMPEVKVAFIGDADASPESTAVLELIKAEKADIVIHSGDLTYDDDPDGWEAQVNAVLGDSFPYLAAVGNHDDGSWPRFQELLAARLAKTPEVKCTGDIGINQSCEYRGVFAILSGVGTLGEGHEAYITAEMAKSSAKWKVCSFHKNQNLMQAGGKDDSVGWEVFRVCGEAGAMVAQGHEHSYSRTHLLSNFETQAIASTDKNLVLEKGKSFTFVSGLGGRGIREQLVTGDWFASVYTSNQNAASGALFCTFNVGGQPDQGSCYFKAVTGEIPDEFTVTSKL